MNLASKMLRTLRPWLRRHPSLKGMLQRQEQRLGMWRHDLGSHFPSLIRPSPRQITIAITAACNLRCAGCRYGRDFMVGEHLDLATVQRCLDDAAAAGVAAARFYGGEPLLHRELPRMIAHARTLGMDAYVTTNATLLGDRIDELTAAGLQWATIGFYGIGADYDEYTGRAGHFAKLESSLATVRARHRQFPLQLNYMLSRRSCRVEDVRAAWALVEQYDLHLGVDPVSRTIPFFREPGAELDVTEDLRADLVAVSDELVRLKNLTPRRVVPSRTFLRALPSLLLENAAASIPCDAYELIWVGADGSVQLCDVAFPLGNLHRTRLRDILFTERHCEAAQRGFQLQCPTCLCKIDSRIRRHSASVRRHGS